MRFTDEYGIAVMVKYAEDHPRYTLVPEWHAWGGEVFAFTDPSLEHGIERNKECAERIGCAIQIRCLRLQDNLGEHS